MKRTKRMTAEELINRLESLSVSDKEKKQNKAYESEKQEIEYAKAFREVLHTGIPTNSVKRGSDGSGGFLVPDTYEKKSVECLEAENILSPRVTKAKKKRVKKQLEKEKEAAIKSEEFEKMAKEDQ